jgi:hypothetical protein
VIVEGSTGGGTSPDVEAGASEEVEAGGGGGASSRRNYKTHATVLVRGQYVRLLTV